MTLPPNQPASVAAISSINLKMPAQTLDLDFFSSIIYMVLMVSNPRQVAPWWLRGGSVA